MKLDDFWHEINVTETNCNGTERVINGVYDSRKVSENYAFFDFNEGKYVDEAIKNGATVVVSEKSFPEYRFVSVDDVRKAFCVFCSVLFSRPEEKTRFIAVVGTNGKTSTVKIIDHILRSNGYKTANIGTLGAEINGVTYSTEMTTPDTDAFYRLMSLATRENVDYVIIELSAHAIYYKKLYNIVFDYCVFTNATPDHLDFFENMEKYIEVKKSVFLGKNVKCAVINVDDETGRDIIAERKEKTLTYGLFNPSDTFAIDVKYDTGINCVVNSCDEISELVTPLCGEFNLMNALAAISVCVNIGIPIYRVCTALSSMPSIDGRYNVLYGKATVIIDYAHTPDGLEKVLSTARKITKRKLIAVFGCGGNRDKQKRAVMGETATRLSDFTIITSDNPRFEAPEKIIEDVIIGAAKTGKNYCVETDREKAVKKALYMAEQGDVVVIAGKGAEEYMEIAGKRIPFSDKKICQEILGRKS